MVKKEIYSTSLEPATTRVENLITRSSNWMHTLYLVAWVLKFLDWIKWHVEKKKDPKAADLHKGINHEDLEKTRIVTVAQMSYFPGEVRSLREGKPVKASSKIIKLKPVMKEDKVMRVGGRISMPPISTDAMNPMILPKGHHIYTILVRHFHEVNGHCGLEQVLSLVREQFWIVKARVN